MIREEEIALRVLDDLTMAKTIVLPIHLIRPTRLLILECPVWGFVGNIHIA
jgi:hypothetical protein